jgi:hypothetical protein
MCFETFFFPSFDSTRNLPRVLPRLTASAGRFEPGGAIWNELAIVRRAVSNTQRSFVYNIIKECIFVQRVDGLMASKRKSVAVERAVGCGPQE